MQLVTFQQRTVVYLQPTGTYRQPTGQSAAKASCHLQQSWQRAILRGQLERSVRLRAQEHQDGHLHLLLRVYILVALA